MIIYSNETKDLETPMGSMCFYIFRLIKEGKHAAILFYSEIYQVVEPIRRLVSYI